MRFATRNPEVKVSLSFISLSSLFGFSSLKGFHTKPEKI
ncbi:hypothetical protein LEP1GSC161_0393 [Leptospira santarosai str. CBC1416]|uniref:Uncharacterized protein n=5 Tax=Leptospira santarosai TaxID=28183 RepID=M6UWF2_9LEPT|nr:hypothetical protein LSS_21420 [Leptospira santarosai serovar Shermani str. LT 821]EKO35767.1 hypothetical protein LEP1GSC179_4212 [Leptospira santarosai str. MOR084]EKO80219.1 hypothetical protein LEP1GSC068_1015 [Leptospira sp. Fiocruz LV3954]EKR92696.1 hypothetical protein LEP1GSC163_2259 [Leptospira santarosai str. CBC379]EKS07177.1 hypothetical protein LEP1GSC071_1736 [Leptospira santarosai str. JET]EMF91240.1 hypothetical protein LEP1GSC005_2763 [Leptospira santarosai str. ST188]EMI6